MRIATAADFEPVEARTSDALRMISGEVGAVGAALPRRRTGRPLDPVQRHLHARVRRGACTAIANGDWVAGGMAAFSLGLDGISMALDPIGSLIAMAWAGSWSTSSRSKAG